MSFKSVARNTALVGLGVGIGLVAANIYTDGAVWNQFEYDRLERKYGKETDEIMEESESEDKE